VSRLLGILSRLRAGGAPGHPTTNTSSARRSSCQVPARTAGDGRGGLRRPFAPASGPVRKGRGVAAEVQGRYRYLLVDEYQDTNDTQLALLTHLAGIRRNLCVVGDDDQSIYGGEARRPGRS